jgi:hypothetical protein
MGGLAGDALQDADENVVVGFGALTGDTLGSRTIAIGRGALQAQNFTSATNTYNTAVGYNAGASVTTGVQNTFVGGLCGDGTNDGDNNVAVGHSALSANCGDSNVAVGERALELSTGDENTAVGQHSAGGTTTGSHNTFLGFAAGNYATINTTGIKNVIVGAYSRATSASADGAVAFGYDVAGEAGYTTVGKSGTDIRAAHGNVTWATVSDQRYKKDIVDSTAGLSFINALQPRTFKYKTLGELPETFRAYEADSTEVFKNSDTNHGFIAQEIKAAIDADSSIADGFKLWDDRDDGSQEVAEAALIPMLTKAIQELSTQLDAALARITTLEG